MDCIHMISTQTCPICGETASANIKNALQILDSAGLPETGPFGYDPTGFLRYQKEDIDALRRRLQLALAQVESR